MKKGLMSIGILVGFLLSILMASGVFAAAAKDVPKKGAAAKEGVIVFTPSYGNVTFTHKDHSEKHKIDCLKCHHTWKKGETTGKLCKECHKAKAEGKTLSVKDAFHKDCQGCHKEAKDAKKPAGPAGCTQCHVKPKK